MKKYNILLLLVMIPFVVGYIAFPNPVPLDGQYTSDAEIENIWYNYTFRQYSSILGWDNTFPYYPNYIIDDFFGSTSDLELVSYDKSFYDISLTNFSYLVPYYTTNNFSLNGTIRSVSAVDWENDGKKEVAVIVNNSIFYILDFNAVNNFSILYSLPNPNNATYYSNIKCSNGECYFLDNRNKIYKASNGSLQNASIGYLGTNNTIAVITNGEGIQFTVDECYPSNSDREIVVITDADSNGAFDDVVWVNEDTLSVMLTQLSISGCTGGCVNSVRPPVCANLDGEVYTFAYFHGGSYSYSFGEHRCYSSAKWVVYDENLDYMSAIGESGYDPSSATFCKYYTSPDSVQMSNLISLEEYGYPYIVVVSNPPPYSTYNLRYDYLWVLNKSLSVVAQYNLGNFVYTNNFLSSFDYNGDNSPEVLYANLLFTILPNGSVSPQGTFIGNATGSEFNSIEQAGFGELWTLTSTSNTFRRYHIPSASPTPNIVISSIFNETFRTPATLNWSLDGGDCSNGSLYSEIGNNLTGYTVKLNLDEEWYCHIAEWSNVSEVVLLYNDNTSRINTPHGAEMQLNTIQGVAPNWYSMSSLLPTEYSFEPGTYISFYCDMANLDNRSFGYFVITDYADSNHSVIALNDDGCNNASNLPFGASCCNMYDIMGYDCSNNSAYFNATVEEIEAQCPEIGEEDYTGVDEIDIMYWKGFESNDIGYVDDILIYDLLTIDQLPVIGGFSPTPSEGEINEPVSWSLIVTDDGSSSEIYTGVDCENDGVLEYPLVQRGITFAFNCTYASTGTKTAKAYVTDVFHYSLANDTQTTNINIVDSGTGSAYGVNCSYFTPPSCILSCYFNDDFNYNYSIICNGWLGTNKTPVNGELVVFDWENYEQLYLNKVSDPIDYYDYASFTFEFDVNISDDQPFNFNIYDKGIDKIVTNIRFDNGQVKVIDSTTPFETIVYEYALDEQFHITGDVNFNTGLINWVVENYTATTEVTDIGVTSAGYFSFYFLYPTQMDMSIDNFYVEKGIVQSLNLTETEGGNFTEKPTYLSTGNFCAINWTSRRFIEEECELRDYNLPEGMEQICLVRACISDSFTWVFYSAQTNIFKTVIIVFVILLVAPLLVALLRRR